MQQDDRELLESCQHGVGASCSYLVIIPTSVLANPGRSSQADADFQMKILCVFGSTVRGITLSVGRQI